MRIQYASQAGPAVGPEIRQIHLKGSMNVCEIGVFKNHQHYESERKKRRYFEQVIIGYTRACETEPLVARNYDSHARTNKRGLSSSHYIADVEIATRRVLKTKALLSAWEALVAGDHIEPHLAARIIAACFRIYAARRLAPHEYFKRTLRTHAA